jgi:hypothetical protein
MLVMFADNGKYEAGEMTYHRRIVRCGSGCAQQG